VANPFNSGCCYCIGQAAAFAAVFSLMDKGSLLSHCCDPIRMAGVAVELARPALGSEVKMHLCNHLLIGVIGEVQLTP